MNVFSRPRRFAALAVVLAAFAAIAAGCSKKVTNADPAYTTLEGTPDANARLVIWPDTPNNVILFDDLPPPGPPSHAGDPTDDTVLTVTPQFFTGRGSVETMLLDGTIANGFQIYRRAGNGGLEPIRDFTLNASRKWLDTDWEVYQEADPTPSNYAPTSYIARGVLAGEVTTRSPLSNEAQITAPTPTHSIAYTGTATPADSLWTLSWTNVPGASGYWIHVYQFRPDAGNDEVIASGTPSPIWNGKVHDSFVGFVPSPAITYKLGGPGALVLTQKPPLFGQEYLVRITAVDAAGQLIAYTQGDTGFIQQATTYEKFLLAARKIDPTRPKIATGPAAAAPAEGIRLGAFGIPNFAIIPARR